MTRTFTEKLIYDEVKSEEGFTHIIFASYLKEEYVERALIIRLDRRRHLFSITFSSNEYGRISWNSKEGLTPPHSWESEDDLRNVSTLASRYPALILNGELDVQYGFETIIPDVLKNLLDQKLASEVKRIITGKTPDAHFDWLKCAEEYKVLSDEFLEKKSDR